MWNFLLTSNMNRRLVSEAAGMGEEEMEAMRGPRKRNRRVFSETIGSITT